MPPLLAWGKLGALLDHKLYVAFEFSLVLQTIARFDHPRATGVFDSAPFFLFIPSPSKFSVSFPALFF
jgi:hypothetical protein